MPGDRESYNRGGFIAFVFSMVFSIGFIVFISFFHPGVEDPQNIQQKAAQQKLAEQKNSLEQKTDGFDPNSVDKPWLPNEKLVEYGKEVYKANCAVCHGASGRGDGPGGGSLQPPARDLVQGNWTKGGTSMALFKTITNGISGTSMASFQHLSQVDRWALVQYIRSITENKPKDNMEQLEDFAQSAK